MYRFLLLIGFSFLIQSFVKERTIVDVPESAKTTEKALLMDQINILIQPKATIEITLKVVNNSKLFLKFIPNQITSRILSKSILSIENSASVILNTALKDQRIRDQKQVQPVFSIVINADGKTFNCTDDGLFEYVFTINQLKQAEQPFAKATIKNLTNRKIEGIIHISSSTLKQIVEAKRIEREKIISQNLAKMQNTDLLFIYAHTLKRHLNGYPGEKRSNFDLKFEKAIKDKNINRELLFRLSKELDKIEPQIRTKVSSVTLKRLNTNQSIKEEYLSINYQKPAPRAILSTSEILPSSPNNYSIQLVGIKSLNCADDVGWEAGCDSEEPYIVWSCFGFGIQRAGRTENAQYVVKGSEYLYIEGTDVLRSSPIKPPIFLVYQVREADDESPGFEDIIDIMASASEVVVEYYSLNYADMFEKALKIAGQLMDLITSMIANNDDDLYPIYINAIDINRLKEYTEGTDPLPEDEKLFDCEGNYPGFCIRTPKITDYNNNDKFKIAYIVSKESPTKDTKSEGPIIRIFANENYGGKQQQFLIPGEYLTFPLVGNDQISSIKITTGYEVELFEHQQHKGKSIILKHDVPRLNFYDFNDRTSSIIIREASPDPPATIYDKAEYRGVFKELPVGSYAKGNLFPLDDNAISSIKIDANYSAYLYQDDNFSGKFIRLDRNIDRLDTYDFNDRISSIRILKSKMTPVVTFYEHATYKGEFKEIYNPENLITKMMLFPVDNDAISSIKITEGYEVTLYADENFGGAFIKIDKSVSDLNSLGFNDRISSIKIEKK